MSVEDPFTAQNARVQVLFGAEALRRIEALAAPASKSLAEVYGPAAMVRYRFYLGGQPEWLAGFRGFFGFHLRGRANTAMAAAADAAGNRAADDPSPADPQWPLKHSHRAAAWLERGEIG